MTPLNFVLFGNQSLLIQCAGKLLESGHRISAIVTRADDINTWASENGIRTLTPSENLADGLRAARIDWILSISYLSIVPDEFLSLAQKGAINFHDGPLPRYAGLNTPVWARIAGETDYAISWHFMVSGIDEGDVILQQPFEIEPSDTAHSLNLKSYAAAIESFDALLGQISSGSVSGTPQTLSDKSYFDRYKRPAHMGFLDFSKTADDIVSLVRGLDHQGHWNPLTTAKIALNDAAYIVGFASDAQGSGQSGEVLEVTPTSLTVACQDGAVRLSALHKGDGQDLPDGLEALARVGDVLTTPAHPDIDATGQALAKTDMFWRRKLETMSGARISGFNNTSGASAVESIDLGAATDLEDDTFRAAVATWACHQQESATATFAYPAAQIATGGISDFVSPWVPVSIDATDTSVAQLKTLTIDAIAQARQNGGFASDLFYRAPEASALVPDIGLTDGNGFITGCAITISVQSRSFQYDTAKLSPEAASLLANRLSHCLKAAATAAPDMLARDLCSVPSSELDLMLQTWNDTRLDYDPTQLMHQAFEAQAKATPDQTALVFEDQHYSYFDLNRKADEVAAALVAQGVQAGDIVGLFIHRCPEMVIAALGILKAGAAYLPLDPAYPAERTEYCLQDSGAKAIVTHSAVEKALPENATGKILVDHLKSSGTPAPSTARCKADDLAYLIYTSGSTGKPKGVMIEHRNVSNFFAAMDQRVAHDQGGTWLAVTSMSFDISVLEIFWTLGRGFKLVLTGDEGRTTLSNGPLPAQVDGMDISLYYWGNDDGHGRDKYKLLLEGSKYADQNGFHAVWTPERHFHAFGGPYPNPSVTGAAVAAVTQNLAVRAGSCVTPLHHTARIAEEWAVIDNLTNGRAGLAVAAGWQPDDFVLRPENTPPANRDVMFEQIEMLRKLWRDEPVAFPKADGTMHEVITQPRPVSKELPIWVTIAGNPDTWRQAGEVGAHVLTHLLGQSIPEVEGKIKIYHQALRDNGYDPADFKITLMLHTFLANDREKARELAREPMKDYLRSAAGLIKQFAWAFPAFKRPKGVDNAFQLDLGVLEEEELEAILEFAFLRYFEDSGFFGTVQDAVNRVEQVKKIGVTEIACLIDYGIPKDTVLEGLRPLTEVVRRCNEGEALDANDFSVAAQIVRHGVTHMQCTPSMARMLLMNDETRQALGGLTQILLGGEALPGALVEEMAANTSADILNMYGPTETTIWSTTSVAKAVEGTVSIGSPIANTRVYVLDQARKPVTIGTAGELWIGGDGVARGYWQRPELTTERFVADPFANRPGARMYQTGDLVCWQADGRLEYIGRTDFQVKLRGYRIEIGEIEAAMDAFNEVTQSAVIVRTESAGDQRLIGYFTAAGKTEEAALRAHLAKRLPPHMVPSRLIQLPHMPLTPNKKTDRKALQNRPLTNPTATTTAIEVSGVGPDTDVIAQRISQVWQHVLGVGQIAPSDNFFEIGGHSLLAVQSHREIRESLDVKGLSITDIFRFPVLRDLCARVADLSSGKQPAKGATAGKPVNDQTAADAPTSDPSDKVGIRSSAMERRRAMRAKRRG